jgi:hypothetical protein
MPLSTRCRRLNSTLKKSLQYLFIRADSAANSAEPGTDPDAVNLPVLKSYCVKIAGVIASSAVLLNGYRLPDLYQLPDLKYMLE